MPKLDEIVPFSKGAAQAYIAKALRAYFEDEQVEVVDLDVKALEVDITLWCEGHGDDISRDTTFTVRLASEEEREEEPSMIALAIQKEGG